MRPWCCPRSPRAASSVGRAGGRCRPYPSGSRPRSGAARERTGPQGCGVGCRRGASDRPLPRPPVPGQGPRAPARRRAAPRHGRSGPRDRARSRRAWWRSLRPAPAFPRSSWVRSVRVRLSPAKLSLPAHSALSPLVCRGPSCVLSLGVDAPGALTIDEPAFPPARVQARELGREPVERCCYVD